MTSLLPPPPPPPPPGRTPRCSRDTVPGSGCKWSAETLLILVSGATLTPSFRGFLARTAAKTAGATVAGVVTARALAHPVKALDVKAFASDGLKEGLSGLGDGLEDGLKGGLGSLGFQVGAGLVGAAVVTALFSKGK
jgi:hypothetical protein